MWRQCETAHDDITCWPAARMDISDAAAAAVALVATLTFLCYILSDKAAATAHIEVRSAPAREKHE